MSYGRVKALFASGKGIEARIDRWMRNKQRLMDGQPIVFSEKNGIVTQASIDEQLVPSGRQIGRVAYVHPEMNKDFCYWGAIKHKDMQTFFSFDQADFSPVVNDWVSFEFHTKGYMLKAQDISYLKPNAKGVIACSTNGCGMIQKNDGSLRLYDSRHIKPEQNPRYDDEVEFYQAALTESYNSAVNISVLAPAQVRYGVKSRKLLNDIIDRTVTPCTKKRFKGLVLYSDHDDRIQIIRKLRDPPPREAEGHVEFFSDRRGHGYVADGADEYIFFKEHVIDLSELGVNTFYRFRQMKSPKVTFDIVGNGERKRAINVQPIP